MKVEWGDQNSLCIDWRTSPEWHPWPHGSYDGLGQWIPHDNPWLRWSVTFLYFQLRRYGLPVVEQV